LFPKTKLIVSGLTPEFCDRSEFNVIFHYMDLCEESPRSVVGHVGDVFPRKRAAQDNIEEGRQRCDSKVLPVVAAPATQRGQYPVFPGHEEFLKNICSQSPV
jgi:hypothetical protein